MMQAGAITGFIAAFTEAPIDFYKSQLQVQVIRSQSDPSYKREGASSTLNLVMLLCKPHKQMHLIADSLGPQQLLTLAQMVHHGQDIGPEGHIGLHFPLQLLVASCVILDTLPSTSRPQQP